MHHFTYGARCTITLVTGKTVWMLLQTFAPFGVEGLVYLNGRPMADESGDEDEAWSSDDAVPRFIPMQQIAVMEQYGWHPMTSEV